MYTVFTVDPAGIVIYYSCVTTYSTFRDGGTVRSIVSL